MGSDNNERQSRGLSRRGLLRVGRTALIVVLGLAALVGLIWVAASDEQKQSAAATALSTAKSIVGMPDREHYTRDLRGDYASRPFNFGDLTKFKHEQLYWIFFQDGPLPMYSRKDVVNLAIARTGSETVRKVLLQNNQPAHHEHRYALQDVYEKGARRVLISIRHPVSRLVSDFQRHGFGKMNHNPKLGNADFIANFHDLNTYFDALRLVDNPLHELALNVTYGYGVKNCMIPVAEYYLRDWKNTQEYQSPEWWAKEKGVEIRFICTATLAPDFGEVAEEWGMTQLMQVHAHSSKFDSENITLITSRPESRLSEANLAWYRNQYRNDFALYERHCANRKTAPRIRSRLRTRRR